MASRPPHDVDPASGNAWVECTCGQRHWGRYGAAGLLLVASGGLSESAEPAVLLQLRAEWTHHGGTWALPGGARSQRESPEQAALREANEEAGLDGAGVRTVGRVVVDHGPWSYTYVLASVQGRPDVRPTDHETQDLAWVGLDAVEAYPLHPLFATAWPGLLRDLRDPLRDGAFGPLRSS